MSGSAEHAPALFVYGTLRAPAVQRAVTGREFDAVAAVLWDYACYQVQGAAFPGAIAEPGAVTQGALLTNLDTIALTLIDAYEADFYERVDVRVQAVGEVIPAQVYVMAQGYARYLTRNPWDYTRFETEGLADYLLTDA